MCKRNISLRCFFDAHDVTKHLSDGEKTNKLIIIFLSFFFFLGGGVGGGVYIHMSTTPYVEFFPYFEIKALVPMTSNLRDWTVLIFLYNH